MAIGMFVCNICRPPVGQLMYFDSSHDLELHHSSNHEYCGNVNLAGSGAVCTLGHWHSGPHTAYICGAFLRWYEIPKAPAPLTGINTIVRGDAPLPPGINWMKIGSYDLKFDTVPKLAPDISRGSAKVRMPKRYGSHCGEHRCTACGGAAPLEMSPCITQTGEHEHAVLDGWMCARFPYKDDPPTSVSKEWVWLCPKCGAETAKFIAHLQQPMIGDEDLL